MGESRLKAWSVRGVAWRQPVLPRRRQTLSVCRGALAWWLGEPSGWCAGVVLVVSFALWVVVLVYMVSGVDVAL